MRKIFFLLVLALWVVAGIQLLRNWNGENEEQIVQAFHQMNCIGTESTVSAKTQMNEYMTQEQQEELLRKVAEKMGITGKCNVKTETVSGESIVQLERTAAKADVHMRVVTLEPDGSDENAKQYFSAEILLYDNLECAVYYKENLEQVLAEYVQEPEVNIQFYGELEGKLTEEEQNELIDDLFDKISAKICRSNHGEDAYTVYAYTNLCRDYERINGDKINVNAAVTFNEQRGCTCLYLAMPVITGDY